MLDSLKELFDNRDGAKTACSKVIGTETNVKDFARFWDRNEKSIGVVGAFCLLEYVTNEAPTPEELIAYKKGLADALLFPGKCSAEMKAIEANKLTTGG